tara:strand:- start:1392 stop:1556 length:165 start_codon:yes stop_codon:yes gene_type:complete
VKCTIPSKDIQVRGYVDTCLYTCGTVKILVKINTLPGIQKNKTKEIKNVFHDLK